MRRTGLLMAAFLFLAIAGRGDETTRAAQEALRTRELYYGDVDGVRSAETAEAVKKFQEKKGFDPTGVLDETTLRALGVLPHGGPTSEVEQSRDFIARYLHACESDKLDAEMGFYADWVDYMEEGIVKKADLQKELAAYRENWPVRRFKVTNCVASPSGAKPGEMIVTYRYDFDVLGNRQERKGTEDLNAVVRMIGGKLQIVAIREMQ